MTRKLVPITTVSTDEFHVVYIDKTLGRALTEFIEHHYEHRPYECHKITIQTSEGWLDDKPN